MPGESPPRRALRWAIGLIAFWSVPALISTSLMYSMGKEGIFRSVASQFPPWMFWAAATVPILALGKAFPLDRGGWARSLPVHLVATALTSFGCLLVAVLVSCTCLHMHYCGEM